MQMILFASMIAFFLVLPSIPASARMSERSFSSPKKHTLVEQRKRQIEEERQTKEKEKERARLMSDMDYLYVNKVSGKYALIEGQLRPFALSRGDGLIVIFWEVLQVVDRNTVLVRDKRLLSSRAGRGLRRTSKSAVVGDPVAVTLEDTAGMVDGQGFNPDFCVRDGTFEYVAVLGAKKTVSRYKRCAPVTLEEFKQFMGDQGQNAATIVADIIGPMR